MNKAVFIDRDGTIAKDVPYCSRPEDFELLSGAVEGIRLLNERGFKVVVITNQSGIARGYFTEQTLAKIHDKMRIHLAEYNACIDAIYYCPHHPADNFDCRKPQPKMVFQAALDLGINLKQSYVIGDSDVDVEMARRAGCKAGVKVTQVPGCDGNRRVSSFKDAVKWIIKQERYRSKKVD